MSMLRAADIVKVRVDKLSIALSLLVRAADELGFTYKLLPEKAILISDGSRAHYFKGTTLPCNDSVAAIISHNKYLTRQILKSENIPTPKSLILRHESAWERIPQSRLAFPLVVKPVTASHGNGSTMNILHSRGLKKAIARTFAYNKKKNYYNGALVEEFFTGLDLRVLVVGGRVVSVLHRIPAYIVGDGQHSIQELVRFYNREWRSTIEYDLPLCPIPFDAELGRYLRRHKRRLMDIPPAGERVQLRWNANVSTGGRTHEITSEVHPALQALAVRCAQLLHLPVAGVDLLVKDYHVGNTQSDNVVVLEVNDAPGTDIHQFPYRGEGKPVAKNILEHIFPKEHRS